ncbi:MAG: response regulator transcription factor [Chloroflexota bacterium]
MAEKIRVTILDDHPAVVDGYCVQLDKLPQTEVVDKLSYGNELEPALEKNPVNVLLLDINVPIAEDDSNPYPVLHIIPKLLQKHTNLNILVISMFAERSLIRAVMEAGASGYILKDDQTAIRDLASVVVTIAGGGVYYSKKAYEQLKRVRTGELSGGPTARQLQALSLSLAYPNSTTADLARMMAISNSTVRNLLSGAYLKLGVNNRAAAIAKARQMGLITPEPPTIPRE